MQEVRNSPSAFWLLGDTSPFEDYSGYSKTATLTGPVVNGAALTPDSEKSQVFNSSSIGEFEINALEQGRESNSFTLTASILPSFVTTTGDLKILSSDSAFDGLSINGAVLSFSTEYVTNGEARCSYDLESNRRVNVAAVHTSQKNSLYVNGVLVDEVDISDEQQADLFVSTGDSLLAGTTTSSASVAINNVAYYEKALTQDDIRAIHTVNNRVVGNDVPGMFGGEILELSTDFRIPDISMFWSEDEDWSSGTMAGASFEDDVLVAERISDLTVPGTWARAVDLYDGEVATTLTSASLIWTGENVVIEASLDGTTWETAVVGENLQIITEGFDPTDKELIVRASFLGGQEEAYLDSLTTNVYFNETYVPLSGRSVTFNNPATNYPPKNIVELDSRWGVELNEGSLEISADPSTDATPVRTVELWVKVNDGPTTLTLADFRPGNTEYYEIDVLGGSISTSASAVQYINGAVTTDPPEVGQWTLVHVVFNTASAGSMFVNDAQSGNLTVGRVALYEDALTAAQIKSIYDNYTGIESVAAESPSVISLSEPLTPALVYSHDWAIVTS